MNKENEKVGFYKRIGKWWVLIIGIVLSIIVLFIGVLTIEGFPTEMYTSFAAFIMLISTAILQNIDLSLQREDLKLNRKALEEQREEMQKHTDEFSKTNESNKESLEMQKFFELIRLKEDLYVEIIKNKNKNNINALEYFNESAIQKIKNQAKEKLALKFESFSGQFGISHMDDEELKDYYIQCNDDNKEVFLNIIDKAIKETDIFSNRKDGVENSIKKLNKYNELLERMTDEGTKGLIHQFQDTVRQPTELLKKSLENFHGRPKKQTTIKHIYNGLLTEDEILLYKIIDRELTLKELFGLEDAD